jgi:hypothetical protein
MNTAEINGFQLVQMLIALQQHFVPIIIMQHVKKIFAAWSS